MSYRLFNALGLFTCIFAMVFAIAYLENHLLLDPCPLCSLTRLIVVSMGILFLLAFLHNPKRFGQTLYAGLNILVGLFGLGVQFRHIWLQNLPEDEVPACGPGLEYMLETLPITDTITQLFQGSGDCATIDWTVLGLTIPMQTALMFVFLLFLCYLILIKKTKRSFGFD